VTIILIKHFVKGATPKAVHKVGGSAGYVNAVRSSFVVVPDGDEPERKLFLPLKFNLVRRLSGFSYQTISLSEPEQQVLIEQYAGHLDATDRDELAKQLFRVEWQGEVDMTADAVLTDLAKQQNAPGKVDQAADWLEQFLQKFAYPSSEVIAAGKAAGHTKN